MIFCRRKTVKLDSGLILNYTANTMAKRKRRKHTSIVQTNGKKGITVVLGRLYIDGKPYKKIHLDHSNKVISHDNGTKVPGNRSNIKLWS